MVELQERPIRTAVDFNAVPEHQQAMDKRLQNWARWANGRAKPPCAPMFRLYKPSDARRKDVDDIPPPVDTLDAQRVQKGVSALPTPHRLSLSWCYITRTNPRRAAQNVGESLEGLARLIQDGRQMLMNRGI